MLYAEAERRKKEEAEHQAKLDEIAEKQRQRERELEEKERQRREEVLRGTPSTPLRPSEAIRPSKLVPVTTNSPTSLGKYVPRHLRERMVGGGGGAQTPPSSEPDRWGRQDDRPSDRWRRSAFGSGGPSRSNWSTSRRGER